MAYTKLKPGEKVEKSKYIGVYLLRNARAKEQICWQAIKIYKNTRKAKSFTTERQAALGYDKILLSFGLEPVNILKRVNANS